MLHTGNDLYMMFPQFLWITIARPLKQRLYILQSILMKKLKFFLSFFKHQTERALARNFNKIHCFGKKNALV